MKSSNLGTLQCISSILGSPSSTLVPPLVLWSGNSQSNSETFAMFTSFISHLLEITVFCYLMSITLKNVLYILSCLFYF